MISCQVCFLCSVVPVVSFRFLTAETDEGHATMAAIGERSPLAYALCEQCDALPDRDLRVEMELLDRADDQTTDPDEYISQEEFERRYGTQRIAKDKMH